MRTCTGYGAVLDEVFGEENFVSQISFKTTAVQDLSRRRVSRRSTDYHPLVCANEAVQLKYRQPFREKAIFLERCGCSTTRLDFFDVQASDASQRRTNRHELCRKTRGYFAHDNLTSQSVRRTDSPVDVRFEGKTFRPARAALENQRHWNGSDGCVLDELVLLARQLELRSIHRRFSRLPSEQVLGRHGYGRICRRTSCTSSRRITKVVERCLLMTTDPGDLVLDPTCGSGTTAYVAEQWGRRWITIDTSRVALALARARIMGARYPYYLLADSPRRPAEGSARSRGTRAFDATRPAATSARASSTSACRTSR